MIKMIKTKLCGLLGIEYSIMKGGMQWLATAEFAATVSNAGGLGTINATRFPEATGLAAEIRKARALTDKTFTVNISMLPKRD